MDRTPTLLLASFICIAGATHQASAQAFPQRPSHFWIDCQRASPIFDDQVLQFIGARGTFFVPHVNVVTAEPFYNLRSIVQRSHQWAPAMPVMLYTHLTVEDTSTAPTYFLPDYVEQGFSQLGPLLVHDTLGNVLHDAQGNVFGDVRQAGFRNWVTTQVSDSLQSLGLDGVITDNYHASAHVAVPQRCQFGTEAFCQQYYNGMLALTTHFRNAISPKPFIFNGLLNLDPYAADQETMLGLCDGATVEFFGYTRYANDSSFTDQVLPFLRQMQAHPNERIFVNGRGINTPYTPYLSDYRWQRYLFGCYLLGADAKTSYHYFTDFAIPSGISGRSSPLDYYDDQYLNMGTPVDTFTVVGGVYYRPFTLGLVAVVPNDAGAGHTFTLGGTYYTPEGQAVTGAQFIQPGQALILLDAPPPPRAHVTRGFEGPTEPTASWPNAQIQELGGDYFLHVDALPTSRREEHDLMLDWDHSMNNFRTMSFRTMTGDATARLLIAADVDDPAHTAMRAVFEVALNGNPPAQHTDSLFLFRVQRIPNGGTQQHLAPFFPVQQPGAADGQWHSYHLNGDSLLAGSNYTFRRFAYMRMVGALDLDDVRLPDSTGVQASVAELSDAVEAGNIYPDPANGSATIAFHTRSTAHINLEVEDIAGRPVRTLMNGTLASGEHLLTMDTSELPQGTYLVTANDGGGWSWTKRLCVVR